jgi:hypothetical protein
MSKSCFICYNKILQNWNPNKISTVTNEEISTQVTFAGSHHVLDSNEKHLVESPKA